MRRPILVMLALAALGLQAGCNSSSTPMNPSPGGNGPELNSSALSPGQAFQHTFASVGTFNYHCTIHPACALLVGTVTVVAAADSIPPVQHVTAISFDPDNTSGCFGALSARATTVHVGETVSWVNNSQAPHTVTSQ